MRNMGNTRILAALAICAAATFTGCDSGSSAPEATANTPTSAAATPLQTTMDDPPTTNSTQTGDASADAALSLATIEIGSHDGFDRVVYSLSGSGVPGYRVTYVDQATEDGSGNPIDVPGASILQVGITGVAYPFEPGAVAYTGPNPLPNPVAGTVIEVHARPPYEGTLLSYVGIGTAQPPFRVSVLSNPTRLVVDVAH
jgi:hypothetical protein